MFYISQLRRHNLFDWFLCLVLLISGLFVEYSGAEDAKVKCDFVREAILDASAIRGLKILRPVPCKIQDQSEVRQYLIDSIEKQIPTSRIIGEELSFKLLGFIPMNFDYLHGLVELYTSQLGGYYDPKAKFYAMASWMPQIVQYPVAVHELTHALQDQHFNLGPLLDSANLTSDTQLAYSSLLEGDAMAVMLDHNNSKIGKGSLAQIDDISPIILQNVIGASLSLNANSSPSTLELYLLFPYSSGLNFVHRLLKKDGYRAVDRAYRSPPRSSTEILHPEKYISRSFKSLSRGTEPPSALLRSLDLENLKPIHTDTLGEFFISTLLSQFISTSAATTAAQGWTGDRVFLYQNKQKHQIAIWNTIWESDDIAKRFFQSFKKATEKRLDKPTTSSTGDEFSLETDNLWTKAEWRANSVLIITGSKIELLSSAQKNGR